MNSDASSDEEYGPTELNQMIQDDFFDSSNSDEEVDMIMLISMQEEMGRQVEHIFNFKGSIKGRRVINRDRGVEAHNDYFKPTRDCCGQLSFCAKQKCTTALRILALGIAADVAGELVGMDESTCLKTTVKIGCVVVRVFGLEYLSEPNAHDTEKLLVIGETTRFSGMIGSIDCMHQQWKNYPKVCGECIKVTPMRPPSYRVLTTTSTCFNDLRCLEGFAMGIHYSATTPSMVVTTTWDTIFSMASILGGLRL
ncbi:hypothetical protein D1007_34633 [Hordeum vulgare]|nr:hypothetical protein D1007_34633 [Hordeum vulgare]